MSQLVGVVLAGGVGRRMGRPKGDLSVGGITLVERAALALAPLCGKVLVSVAPGAPNPAPAFEPVADTLPAGRGPLAGLVAAYGSSGGADLLVLACDYPHVETGLLREIVARADPGDDLVILTDPSGRDHPLVGLWRRRAVGVVRRAVAHRRYKVRALLADLEVCRLGPSELTDFDLAHALVNLNTPADRDSLD